MPPPFFILPVTEMYRCVFTMAECCESDNIYGLRLSQNIGTGKRVAAVKNFDNGKSRNR